MELLKGINSLGESACANRKDSQNDSSVLERTARFQEFPAVNLADTNKLRLRNLEETKRQRYL